MASVPLKRGSVQRVDYVVDGSLPRTYWAKDNRRHGYRLVPKPMHPTVPLPYSSSQWNMYYVRGSKRDYGAVYPTILDHNVDDVCGAMMTGHGVSSRVYGSALVSATNKAYSKLVDKVHGTRADLGTTLAESREAVNMIVDRATWLGKAYKQLRKGNFRGFINTIGMKAKPKHRRTRWTRPKDASGLWLEYWMGWAPTVGDIHAATEVIMKGPRGSQPYPVRAGARTSVQKRYSERDGEFYTWTGVARVHNGAMVKVTNENLATLGELGLLNPAVVAWNVVPFSFMVDWFGNIGSVLSSYTDFMGYELTGTWTTRLVHLDYVGSGSSVRFPGHTFLAQGKYAGLDRVTSIQKPVLQFKRPNGLSVTRAATSISLLVSIFTKG